MFNRPTLQEGQKSKKMELKKNAKKDLTRNSGIYFAIGLFLVMALTYAALEWKSFYDTVDYQFTMNVEEELIEEIELFNIEKPKPAPVVIPPVLEIVPDDDEIIESVIDAVEPNQDTEIAKVEDIEVAKIDPDLSIPFSVIEDVPVFPGCENESDKRACFNKMMQKHIIKNFRYPELEKEMGIQGKVNIMFEIQKDGSIGNLRMRGPNKNLENEAARIIDKLPKMTPGKQRGNPVRVPFSIPITFKLQ